MRTLPRNKEDRLQARAHFIPKDARPVGLADLGAIAYAYDQTTSRGMFFGGMGFIGSAARPAWHYSFKTAEARDKYVAQWLDAQTKRALERAERDAATRKARAEFVNPYKVGDILHSSWGYDQTNVEWFQVVAVGAKTITIREIACKIEETCFMAGNTEAQRDQFVGPEIVRTIQIAVYNGKLHHHVCSPIHGYLYTGRTSSHCSWYA